MGDIIVYVGLAFEIALFWFMLFIGLAPVYCLLSKKN